MASRNFATDALADSVPAEPADDAEQPASATVRQSIVPATVLWSRRRVRLLETLTAMIVWSRRMLRKLR
jgi:hypothetical protein